MEDCIKQLDETHAEYLLTKLKDECLQWIDFILVSEKEISLLLLTSLNDTINIILGEQQNQYEPFQNIQSIDEQKLKQILNKIQKRI